MDSYCPSSVPVRVMCETLGEGRSIESCARHAAQLQRMLDASFGVPAEDQRWSGPCTAIDVMISDGFHGRRFTDCASRV